MSDFIIIAKAVGRVKKKNPEVEVISGTDNLLLNNK